MHQCTLMEKSTVQIYRNGGDHMLAGIAIGIPIGVFLMIFFLGLMVIADDDDW